MRLGVFFLLKEVSYEVWPKKTKSKEKPESQNYRQGQESSKEGIDPWIRRKGNRMDQGSQKGSL